VVPGHVIEDMWFQIDIARLIGREHRIPQACDLIRRHLEFGWDADFGGGLFLAKDANGGPETAWPFPDTKIWWPHTEALYALLDAHFHQPEKWCLEWYDKVLGHCLKHYCDFDHGEWRQKLNRDQTPFHGVVAFPVKDPFHLPRSLILQIEGLQRMLPAAGPASRLSPMGAGSEIGSAPAGEQS
jgi:N-acylglucosamine 2-epimerase